jgi:TolB-like protein
LRLIAELRRRNVFRMAGLYLVGSWLIVQVAETLLPIFETPAWVLKVLVVLLAVGLVPALVFSWVYELTPEGLRRESELPAARGTVDSTARKLDVAVILLLIAIGALTLWGPQRGVPAPYAEPANVEQAADSVAASPDPAPAPNPEAASIAVLPFADLSQGGDQGYFSDGISEEILNALVKVKGLQVASRTSSFAFKGHAALGVPAIAAQLSVRHVLEGSVRRAGDTLRITAQLIDAQTDRHLWSESYDRPLSAENLFAIQEEIATAIVAALKASLDVPDVGPVSVRQSTANLGAYDLYLQARALFLARRSLDRAEALLEQALSQDPAFARAWELRAAVNSLMDEYKASDLGPDELERLSAEYAERALALDPQSSLALAALANVRSNAGRSLRETADMVGVIADLERAIELDPHNINAMNWLGIALALVGDSERALSVFQRCTAIDRRFGPCTENEYDTLWVLGRADEAYARMLDAWSRGVSVDGYVNFHLLAHFEQKTAFLLALNHPFWMPQWGRGEALYQALREPDQDHSTIRDELLAYYAQNGRSTYASALLVPLGAFDEAPPSWLIWGAEFRRYRQSAQFRSYIERSGALAYWRAKGFPSRCRAIEGDSFACD